MAIPDETPADKPAGVRRENLSAVLDEFADIETDISSNTPEEDGRHVTSTVHRYRSRAAVRVAKLLV